MINSRQYLAMNWLLAIAIVASVLPLLTTDAAPCCGCCGCCGCCDEDISSNPVTDSNSDPVDSADRQRSPFGLLRLIGRGIMGAVRGTGKVIGKGGKMVGNAAGDLAVEGISAAIESGGDQE